MNASTSRESVANAPGVVLVGRLHALARRGPASWETELTRAGLRALPSKAERPPRVSDCRVHRECRAELLHKVDEAREPKTAKQGTDVPLFGRVVAVSADAEIVRAPTYDERVRRLRPFGPRSRESVKRSMPRGPSRARARRRPEIETLVPTTRAPSSRAPS